MPCARVGVCGYLQDLWAGVPLRRGAWESVLSESIRSKPMLLIHVALVLSWWRLLLKELVMLSHVGLVDISRVSFDLLRYHIQILALS